MKRLLTCFSLVLIFALGGPARAEQSATPVDSAGQTPFPGVAEIFPRLAKLTEEKSTLDNLLNQLGNLDTFNGPMGGLRRWRENLDAREKLLGPIEEWPLENLQQSRVTLLAHRDQTAGLLDELFMRLTEIEKLTDEWKSKQRFWAKWEKSFAPTGPAAPAEAFSRARQIIDPAVNQLAQIAPQLLALQQEITDLQAPLSDRIGKIEELLALRKTRLFERNHPPFFSPDFYRQFNIGLFASPGTGLSRMDFFNAGFWHNRSGLVVSHLILAVFIIGLLYSRRKRHVDPLELHFTLRHPLATGLFLSTIIMASFYTHAPAGWMLILTVVAILSALPLITYIFTAPLQKRVIRLLAFAYILSRSLRALSFPAPLYSLYIAVLSLAGIMILRWVAGCSLRNRPDRQYRFRNMLTAGMIFLGATFVAQICGYSNLAEHLLNAGLKTVFACLLAVLTLRLLHSGLLSLGKLRFFKRQRFFRRHGQDLQNRLRHLAPVVVITQTALYLMVVWHLFDSMGEAWHAIVSAGVTLGEKTVTVKMVLIGLAALYLAILVSWLLRSLLEEEVFPRRQMDRGVRDSIKKLLNYAILALGVLMALSLAGIELKNFAVLAGALGIGIGFGLQNIVNNFVSGLILLFERPIKIGDMIVLDGEWGTVLKIGLRSTTVETFDQSEVIVPNSILVSEKVTNWTLSSEQSRIVVPVGVAYGSDVEKVLRILYDAAQDHPKVLDAPPPSAIFTAFGTSSLDFELRVWATSVRERLVIKNDLLLYIDRRFREEDVEIPFPQRDLHLRSIDEKVLDHWNTTED